MNATPQEHPPLTLGRYQLVREIARSNDIVWEGVDPTMNRRVAVKELALPASVTGEARRNRIERFYREARAAGAMSHPDIVTIYEVGEDAGRFFIAMEYLEGQTLRERLSIGGALPLAEAVHVAEALSEALEYAHAHGVVHRDIKPENVHLLPGGRVKLTDFGIARITHEEQLTVAGQVFGTPSYMAPEQILGKPVDARSDLFALGVLLYEMITGRKPFTQPGDSVVTITYRIINDAAPAPVGIPRSMEALLERAMAKAPEGRFQSAADFHAALLGSAASAAAHTGRAPAFAAGPGPAYAAPLGGPPAALQATVQYGAHTQVGVAPGLAFGRDATVAGDPPSPRLAEPPQPTGAPAYLPRYAPKDDRAGRVGATLAVILVGIAVILGGGWALSTAYQNAQTQAAYARAAGSYTDAMKLYTAGQYEQSAQAFQAIRSSRAANSELVTKATQGEIYSYRQLGHAAQDRGDFPAAVRWYQSAVALAPSDQQAQSELAAAQRRAGGAGVGGAAAAATAYAAQTVRTTSDVGAGNNPLASVLAPPTPAPAPSGGSPAAGTPNGQPSVTTNDFVNANSQAAAGAMSYFQQGEAAYRRGDRATALQRWHDAVAAGPGSPGAIQAQQRITQVSSQLSPY